MTTLLLHRMTADRRAYEKVVGAHHALQGHKALVDDPGYHHHVFLDHAFDGHAPSPFALAAASSEAITWLAWTTAALRPGRDIRVMTKEVGDAALAVGRRLVLSGTALPYRRVNRSPHRRPEEATSDTLQGALDFAGWDNQEGDPGSTNATMVQTGDREVEVYQAAKSAGTTQTPEEVYAAWVTEQLARSNGVQVDGVLVDRIATTTMLRQTQARDRKQSLFTRTVVHYEATVRTTNREGLTALLVRGVGRHRAFGHGAVLVRPG